MPSQERTIIRSGASIPTPKRLLEDADRAHQSPRIANVLGLARRLPANGSGPLAESSAKSVQAIDPFETVWLPFLGLICLGVLLLF